MTVNLAASLRGTAADLSGVATGLAGLSTEKEIEHQAKILDCIAEDASQSAAILRALIVARKRTHGLLGGCHAIPPACTGFPPGAGSDAS